MNQKLIAEIGKSQRLQIVNTLKRTQGLAVKALSRKLKMSYMGVKQHCIDLEKEGYLDTWRKPVPRGRPEMIYRLTRKAHELFPTTSNQWTIELLASAIKLYGPSAPEKLLFTAFQQLAEKYRSKLKGSTLAEKTMWLARFRDNEGCMSEFEEEDGLRIVEYHSPIQDLLTAYPIVARLECDMIQRVLKSPVRREEASVSGLFCCTFHVG